MPSEQTSDKERRVSRLADLIELLARSEGLPLPKITREQIDTMLKVAEDEGRRQDRLTNLRTICVFGLAALTIVAACFLCWIFLFFGQPQYVDKVITAVVGGIGGFGISWGIFSLTK